MDTHQCDWCAATTFHMWRGEVGAQLTTRLYLCTTAVVCLGAGHCDGSAVMIAGSSTGDSEDCPNLAVLAVFLCVWENGNVGGILLEALCLIKIFDLLRCCHRHAGIVKSRAHMSARKHSVIYWITRA